LSLVNATNSSARRAARSAQSAWSQESGEDERPVAVERAKDAIFHPERAQRRLGQVITLEDLREPLEVECILRGERIAGSRKESIGSAPIVASALVMIVSCQANTTGA
jgi:hypothetical protein